MLVAATLLGGGLAGCATPPPASDPEALADFEATNDPLEPTNRVFYKINDGLDTIFLRPAATAYHFIVPRIVRTGIHNVLDNLGGPVRLADDALQGKPGRAGDTALRFLINTTIGVGGIFDIAKDMGFPNHDSDFGMALASWGVPEGPFLFLPVLGPSSPRDAVGFGADIALDPFTWIGRGTNQQQIGSWARTGAGALDSREGVLDAVDQIKKTALDPYATFRSLYRQNRAAKIEKLRADKRGLFSMQGPGANERPRDQTAQ